MTTATKNWTASTGGNATRYTHTNGTYVERALYVPGGRWWVWRPDAPGRYLIGSTRTRREAFALAAEKDGSK